MGLRVDIKNFFCDHLPAVDSAIYTVPAGRRAIIKSIRLVNDSDMLRTVNLRVIHGNRSARIENYNFQLCGRAKGVDSEDIYLDTGDRVMASCDLANAVTCLMGGVEEILQ